MREIEGQLSAAGIRFGIIASRFNSLVVDNLLSGAIDAIVRHGGSKNDITIVKVPGSFEIPLAAKKLAASGAVDAIVALGAVIRGSTTHYDYVCQGTTSGIMSAQIETGIPIGFGVLTCENLEQAMERAGSKGGNKGADAALAVIEMVNVARALEKSSR